MPLPKVAIIGRPNVGKSSLFNSLAGKMISIVEPTPGVTRDRVSVIIEAGGKHFELVDTGGIGIVDKDHLEASVEKQITIAIETADLIVFVVDIRDGIMPLDKKIADLLRRKKSIVIPVANKADVVSMFEATSQFYKLGFGEFFPVSCANNLNKKELLDVICSRLPQGASEKPVKSAMKLAIVGKRNSGKSTLVNCIAGEERVIVSEVPGTTRDSVDVRIERNGKIFTVIDTAGVRKKSRIKESVDFYSFVRAKSAIKRADVVLFLIDAATAVSDPDKKLASFIAEEYKPVIIVVNKWDIAEKQASIEDYQEYLAKVLGFMKEAPIAFTVATEGKNVYSVLELADELFGQASQWIPTPKLNKAFEKIMAERRPGTKKGTPRIYYATQTAVNPVTILMFVNRPQLFDDNYRRFITNRLHDLLPVPEVPIKLLARSHRSKEKNEPLRNK
jgi:GTP-binding protein